MSEERPGAGSKRSPIVLQTKRTGNGTPTARPIDDEVRPERPNRTVTGPDTQAPPLITPGLDHLSCFEYFDATGPRSLREKAVDV